jgi:hypothetical protein
MGDTMDIKGDKNSEHASVRRATVAPSVAYKKSGIKSVFMTIIVVVIVAVLAIGGWFAYDTMRPKSQAINTKEYQAVFLTNGQVYFGKLQNTEGRYLSLKSIYYLQVQQAVQPADVNATAAGSKTQLVKLGNELHGPEDSMQISHDQILFWENLVPGGKVSQAIASYKP